MNNLIHVKLKEIIKLQDIITKDDLNNKSKHRKTDHLVNVLYLLLFKGYT